MKITIVCVGKIKEKFFRDAISEYTKRLSRYCKLDIVEVVDEKTPDKASEIEETMIKQEEAKKILKVIKEDSFLIATAIDGKSYDSVAFGNKIQKLGIYGESHITFIIGGSLGLHDSVYQRANEKISFSSMTFPHQLMRVILLEQIYRGFRIVAGEPYHK